MKPANIKVTPDGVVKVLDFGLATASAPETSAADISNSPTVTGGPTGAGTLLGTAPYMSPEQARGLAVDKRSDVWAFGCVLFEMLTARRAFSGATTLDALAAILHHEPEWAALPATTPPGVRRLLQRCLVKDPKRRLRDIADARLEIDDALAAPASDVAAVPIGRTSRQTWLWMAALLLSAAAAGAGVWMLRPRPAATGPTPRLVARVAITPAEPITTAFDRLLAISPDGRRVAYAGGPAGARHLYVRSIDQFESKPIPGTEDAGSPEFSPEGDWIAFTADRKLKKVALAGGLPLTLSDLSENQGDVSWAAGMIFFQGSNGAIWRVPEGGGAATPVTQMREREVGHNFPSVLPDGKAVLFSVNTGIEDLQINVESLETGVRHVIGNGAGARYLPSGHIVFARGGTLFAVTFDPVRLEATGAPVSLLDGIAQPSRAAAQVSFAQTGSMVYLSATGARRPDALVWLDRRGTEQPTSASADDFMIPRLAPDARRVVVMASQASAGSAPGSDLWLYDLDRGSSNRLTFDSSSGYPAWTPDGRQLAFISSKNGPDEIFLKSLDGGADELLFKGGSGTNRPFSWTQDGQTLAFVSINPATSNDIWVLDRRDRGKPRPLIQTPFREGAPAFSPDGRWIAYVSRKSGRDEVYLQPYPGPGEDIPVSTAGGTEPAWAHGSGQLFYRQGDGIFAVDITTAGTLSVAKPRLLFKGSYAPSRGSFANYDVTPDGQRFIMVKRGNQTAVPTQINVVLNWLDELKTRVATK